ncbi:MAG: hypothetical protein M5R42_05390 [Rhodocyclaceae bacterium]|nr:hypothetical protein [Rhodocyclaceae bacterium]
MALPVPTWRTGLPHQMVSGLDATMPRLASAAATAADERCG